MDIFFYHSSAVLQAPGNCWSVECESANQRRPHGPRRRGGRTIPSPSAAPAPPGWLRLATPRQFPAVENPGLSAPHRAPMSHGMWPGETSIPASNRREAFQLGFAEPQHVGILSEAVARLQVHVRRGAKPTAAAAPGRLALQMWSARIGPVVSMVRRIEKDLDVYPRSRASMPRDTRRRGPGQWG